jgi:hypothetical protein
MSKQHRLTYVREDETEIFVFNLRDGETDWGHSP